MVHIAIPERLPSGTLGRPMRRLKAVPDG